MFKLLIIDDEPHVREGLADLIDWEQIGLTVCGIGVNGKDGMEKIKELKPDICLIDIRMPGMTGIEVIREAKALGIDCQFIILSGYSDFNYAKEAISLEVHDYLLKPVDEDELLEAAKRISVKLGDKSQYERFKVEGILKKILNGDVLSLEREYYDCRYQLGAFHKEASPGKLMSQLAHLEGAHLLKDERVMIFLNQEGEVVEKALNKLVDKYQLPLALSSPGLNVHQVQSAYEEVGQLMQRAFFFSKPLLLLASMFKGSKLKGPVDFEELYFGIEFGNKHKKEQALRDITTYYQKSNYSVDRVKGELANLQGSIVEKFQVQYPNLKIPPKESLMNTIYSQGNLADILREFARQWDRISAEIEDDSGLGVTTMKKIQHYVEQYYYEELSLRLMGEMFNYNPTYLGKKFKEQIGENFPKYVDRVRIEHAKRLLTQEKLKVYEVSDRVGYCNMDYFYRKFKHYTGKSPKEYQKATQKVEEDAS